MSERDAFNQDIEIKGMNFKVFFCSLSVEFIHKKNVEAALGSFLNSSSTFFVCVQSFEEFFYRNRFWIIHDDASTQSLKLDVTKNENKNFVYVQIFSSLSTFQMQACHIFFQQKKFFEPFETDERDYQCQYENIFCCAICVYVMHKNSF